MFLAAVLVVVVEVVILGCWYKEGTVRVVKVVMAVLAMVNIGYG